MLFIFLIKKKTIINQKNQKNIIVLLLDGLRKDMIYGNGKNNISPSINNFFSKFTRYDNAYTQGEWTLPAFASMVTSLYSSHHRVIHPDYSKTRQLPESVDTCFEIMQKWLPYIVPCKCSRVSHLFGYQRGNDSLFYPHDIRDSKSIIFNTLDFLNKKSDVNKFIFLHLMDLRSPLKLSSPYCWDDLSLVKSGDLEILNKTNQDSILNEEKYFTTMYRNKIKETDLLLGILFDKIENSNLKSNTSVILTSDHGINLPTDGVENWRKKQFSEERMQVPLFLRCPWRDETFKKTYSGYVESSIDLSPTIFDLSGVEANTSSYSKSFLPDLKGNFTGKKHIISEMLYKDRYDCRIIDKEFEYLRSFYFNNDEPNVEIIKKIKDKNFLNPSNKDYLDILKYFQSLTLDLNLLTKKDSVLSNFKLIDKFI